LENVSETSDSLAAVVSTSLSFATIGEPVLHQGHICTSRLRDVI
jgi:hypothetical protein